MKMAPQVNNIFAQRAKLQCSVGINGDKKIIFLSLFQRSCFYVQLALQAKADQDLKISKMAPQVHTFFCIILHASWSLHVSKFFAQLFVTGKGRQQAFIHKQLHMIEKEQNGTTSEETLFFTDSSILICIYFKGICSAGF